MSASRRHRRIRSAEGDCPSGDRWRLPAGRETCAQTVCRSEPRAADAAEGKVARAQADGGCLFRNPARDGNGGLGAAAPARALVEAAARAHRAGPWPDRMTAGTVYVIGAGLS